jgi:hypothetical protein
MVKTTIQYEHILRAIGQGLEALAVEAFGLEVASETFLINGTARESGSAKRGAFRKAFLDICQMSTKAMRSETLTGRHGTSSRLVRLQFTQHDIDKLEKDGQALRSNWNGSPLAHSLPQLLRTVGWYVDNKQGQLQKITKGDSLRVSYIESTGKEKSEIFTLLQLYDMWVHLYKRRKGRLQIA